MISIIQQKASWVRGGQRGRGRRKINFAPARLNQPHSNKNNEMMGYVLGKNGRSQPSTPIHRRCLFYSCFRVFTQNNSVSIYSYIILRIVLSKRESPVCVRRPHEEQSAGRSWPRTSFFRAEGPPGTGVNSERLVLRPRSLVLLHDSFYPRQHRSPMYVQQSVVCVVYNNQYIL